MTDEIMNQQDYVDPYDVQNTEDKSKSSGSQLLNPFNLVIVAAVLLIVGVVVYGIYQNQQGTIGPGEEAPDFTLTTYDGEDITLSDFRDDKVVVINFWHNECPPCHTEANILESVYRKYEDRNVIFLGVNVKDPDRVAFGFMDKYNITYPNGLDRADKINKDMYRTTGWPETFIVDREGIITMHHAGPISEAKLTTEIEKALGTLDPGDTAPGFSLETFDGQMVSLDDYTGEKVIVLNFWNSGCSVCQSEAPTLKAVSEAYEGDNVVFIGVNVRDREANALAFIEQYGVPYLNGMDTTGDLYSKYRLTGYPETFVIDLSGTVTLHHLGAISEQQLSEEIDVALGRERS